MPTKPLVIFYSWLSDISFHRKSINDALRGSITDVEKSIGEIAILIDEATRDTVGSVHLPDSIFKKISNSDIFICDLSIIGESADSSRKIANPNVLIELGYAIAELGWPRIIILFNKKFGLIQGDLPFDIEKRRVLDLKINDQNDKSGIGQLRVELTPWIEAIINNQPIKQRDVNNVVLEKKRKNDVSTLTMALKCFDLKKIDYFIKYGEKEILDGILNMKIAFEAFVRSTEFHLYDLRAKNLIDEMLKTWNHALSHLGVYTQSDDLATWRFGNPIFRLDQIDFQNEKLKSVRKDINEFETKFREFINHLRAEYLEIDF